MTARRVTKPQRVSVAAGDGYDLLVSAVAVADRDWCSVLRRGPELRAAVLAAGGARLVADAARFGRFGWINLIGLLARERGAGSRARLLDVVTASAAEDLHFVLAGGLRTQLTGDPASQPRPGPQFGPDRLAPDRLRGALAGDPTARTELRRVLGSPRLLLDISGWLQSTPSPQVKDVLLRTLESWPDVGDPRESRASLRTAERRRADLGDDELLRQVTPGIRYGPTTLERVLLVSSPLVEPILISVDQSERTIIVHPPLLETGMADAATLLSTQGAAVGDRQRVQVLQELRGGPRTLADLCTATGRPRTTLLHHLALLRAAGFVTLTVTAGEPNIYRLDPDGFHSLARAAAAFVLD